MMMMMMMMMMMICLSVTPALTAYLGSAKEALEAARTVERWIDPVWIEHDDDGDGDDNDDDVDHENNENNDDVDIPDNSRKHQ